MKIDVQSSLYWQKCFIPIWIFRLLLHHARLNNIDRNMQVRFGLNMVLESFFIGKDLNAGRLTKNVLTQHIMDVSQVATGKV